MKSNEFQNLVWQKGKELYRTMPWREDTRPYYVLVSELMLQQTQVDRVIPKFTAFIAAFPSEAVLAKASLAEVLGLWSGLGYNRRAKFLHLAAKMICEEYDGVFPDSKEQLLRLPGVGTNTAGAILAYAFNTPAIFIETNVRTVYFQHFFLDGRIVDDKELASLLEQTLDHEHPREFYWALMDYGASLKRSGAARLKQSKHYKKQSPLKGSVREVRGEIIRLLASKDYQLEEIEKRFEGDQRLQPALRGLIDDGLVQQTGTMLHLTK
jgi:A/G-specific adenine glycosylase